MPCPLFDKGGKNPMIEDLNGDDEGDEEDSSTESLNTDMLK